MSQKLVIILAFVEPNQICHGLKEGFEKGRVYARPNCLAMLVGRRVSIEQGRQNAFCE